MLAQVKADVGEVRCFSFGFDPDRLIYMDTVHELPSVASLDGIGYRFGPALSNTSPLYAVLAGTAADTEVGN